MEPTKERKPVLTRSQLLVLRMAAGVTPHSPSLGANLRNHVIVPADHANPFLEAATGLEEIGALTTSPEDDVRGENQAFVLTPIGTDLVRPVGSSYLSQGLEVETDTGPRSRAIEHLLAAQSHLIEARGAIERYESASQNDGSRVRVKPPSLVNFLGALTMFLGLTGEAVYQLRQPVGRSGIRG